MNRKFEYRKASFVEALAQDPNRDFFTPWLSVSEEDCSSLEAATTEASREQDLQAFLEANPHLLILHLRGGHGRWVIPQKRLGSEYVTDFVIGDKDSIGYHWTAVELESPTANAFTKSGNDSAHLSHARRQIEDWRMWLRSNGDYARRPRSENGLNLQEISEALPGLIIIGRRDERTTPQTNMRRRAWKEHYNIEVHTYDWLMDNARASVRP